jgi:hypothetical protein
LTASELDMRRRIAALVESVEDDQVRSRELFHYVWTMICVRRGLLRVVREVSLVGKVQVVLEEVKTGRQRLVSKPKEMDSEIEGLAVQALTRILGEIRLKP